MAHCKSFRKAVNINYTPHPHFYSLHSPLNVSSTTTIPWWLDGETYDPSWVDFSLREAPPEGGRKVNKLVDGIFHHSLVSSSPVGVDTLASVYRHPVSVSTSAILHSFTALEGNKSTFLHNTRFE